MAAHSSTTGAVNVPVAADQPRTGWPQWLREIAQAINLFGVKAVQIDAAIAAGSDYAQGQTAMSGGGTVTWGGLGGKLGWTGRFLCLPMAQRTASAGYVEIAQPIANIPAGQVYDGLARTADAAGVVLNAWEALYAAHTVGSGSAAITLYIVSFTAPFAAPPNWLLIATVNGDDGSVKLGTGKFLP